MSEEVTPDILNLFTNMWSAMSITIPFATNIGPNSGTAGDGVVYGSAPQVAAVTALSQVHLSPFTKVLRGNADASSNVAWSNVTTAANDDTAGDISLFDTVNPTADRLCIELSSGDEINGISFLVSTAAVLAGTPAAIVRYKGTDNAWKTAVAVVTPTLTSTGLKKIGFTKISYADIALTDDLLDPISNPQMRCLFVEFSGITSVTTAPLFTRVWKNIVHNATHKSANFTTLISQGPSPDFSTAQATILPVANDLTLFGFNEKPLRLFPTIYRLGNTGHLKEWVYSRASDFAAIPPAAVSDNTVMFTALGVADPRPLWNAHTNAADLAARKFHFRPEELPASGAIASWGDAAAGAGAATQSTATAQPQVSGTQLNGKNVAIFDGGDSLATAAVPALHGTEATLFILLLNPTEGNETVLSQEDTSARRRFHVHPRWAPDDNIYADFGDSGANRIVAANSPFVGADWHLITVKRSGTSLGQIFNNGSLLVTDTTLGTPAAFTANALLRIGGDGSGINLFTGSIAVILGYDTALTDAQRELVEGSLMWEFGIQANLPVTHTYATVSPRAGTPPAAHIPVVPPADWAKQSLTDTADVVHDRYWIGFRTTADTVSPILPSNFTLRAQVAKGTGNDGIPAPETKVYTRATIVARDPGITASTILIVNATTGAAAEASLAANSTISTGVINLSVTSGDLLLLVQPIGDAVVANNPADGAVFLS